MDGQQRFIRTLKAALNVDPADDDRRRRQMFSQSPTAEQNTCLERIAARRRNDRLALLEHLKRQANPLNLDVQAHVGVDSAAGAIVDLVCRHAPEWGDDKSVVQWNHPLLARLDLARRLAGANVPVHTAAFMAGKEKSAERERIRGQVAGAFVGVTAADWCLADTATVVMKSRPGQARMVSLVPAIHVAVVTLDQLLADIGELYALLKWTARPPGSGLPHHMVMISGPSKTADIELVMVHGAHGPRQMHLMVITGP